MGTSSEYNPSSFSTSRTLGSGVLLSELQNGKEIQLAGNFIPKYIFQLVSEMASSLDEITGYLNLWFLIPKKFVDRPDSIASLVELVHKNAETPAEANNFIEECLLLIENQGLGFNLGFYKSDPPKTPLVQAVVFARDELDAFWALSDNKPGFADDELNTFSALEIEEFVDARNVFNRILSLANNSDARIEMYKGGEVIGWLGFASDWGAEVDVDIFSSDEVLDSDVLEFDLVEDDEDDDIESIVFAKDSQRESKFDIFERNKFHIYDSVKQFLAKLPEFMSESDYVYSIDDEDEIAALDFIKYCDVTWGRIDLDLDHFGSEHHIPPIFDERSRDSVGMKTAICICGTLFIRAHGCYEVSW